MTPGLQADGIQKVVPTAAAIQAAVEAIAARRGPTARPSVSTNCCTGTETDSTRAQWPSSFKPKRPLVDAA